MFRLLNTTSLQLCSFIDDEVPPYAILSHRRVYGELNFKEWMSPKEDTNQKSGYKKIISACQRAFEDNLEWLWVDTICINQIRIAELEEAINSSFAWYR